MMGEKGPLGGKVGVKCQHCGHEWLTRSSRRAINCPKCGYKVTVRKTEEAQVILEAKSLENWLWDAACTIRGAVDAPKFKDYILPLIFAKRLSDVYDDEVERLTGEFGDRRTALELVEKDRGLVRFYIPEGSRWEEIRKFTSNIGQRLTDSIRAIGKENASLQGVIDIVDFNATVSGQRIIDDDRLKALIEVLSDPRYRLGLKDVEPDILGRAYEYLLRKFAEGQGQSAGEFFTPKEVGWTIAYLLHPEEGQEVYDPACGSGGLLIKAQLALRERIKDVKIPLRLYAQELNHVTYAMSRMNMIVHDMEGEIVIGDTLKNPKFLEGSGLKRFDRVAANPMWNQDGYNGGFYENDPHERFTFGYPPASSADWGWVQHILASLKDRGRAVIVLDTGAVSRGSGSQGSNKEKEIRKAMVEKDLIEGVVLLPENLFYNTTAPGILLLLNRHKPRERKGRIILINASQEFEKGRPKNYIPEPGIRKIADAYHAWREVEGFAKIITAEEAAKNDYNLSPSRYVGPATSEETLPLPDAVAALAEAERKRAEADRELGGVLANLGFKDLRFGDYQSTPIRQTPIPQSPTLGRLRALLRERLPELREKYGVTYLGIFGSRLRGDARPESDLDVLVEFDERRPLGLLTFIGIENELSDLLGVKVDLVEKKALKPRIGQRVLREVVPV